MSQRSVRYRVITWVIVLALSVGLLPVGSCRVYARPEEVTVEYHDSVRPQDCDKYLISREKGLVSGLNVSDDEQIQELWMTTDYTTNIVSGLGVVITQDSKGKSGSMGCYHFYDTEYAAYNIGFIITDKYNNIVKTYKANKDDYTTVLGAVFKGMASKMCNIEVGDMRPKKISYVPAELFTYVFSCNDPDLMAACIEAFSSTYTRDASGNILVFGSAQKLTNMSETATGFKDDDILSKITDECCDMEGTGGQVKIQYFGGDNRPALNIIMEKGTLVFTVSCGDDEGYPEEKKLGNQDSIKNNLKRLSGVSQLDVDRLSSFVVEFEKRVDALKNKQAAQASQPATTANVATKYDYFAQAVVKLRYGNKTAQDEAMEALKNFPEVDSNKVTVASQDDFSEEEQERVKAFAKILLEDGCQVGASYDVAGISGNLIWDSSTRTKELTNYGLNSNAHTVDSLQRGADELFKVYSEHGVSVASEEAEIQNALAIAKYYAAVMYGLKPTDNVADSNHMKQCRYIESITLKVGDQIEPPNVCFTKTDKEGNMQFYGLPEMNRINNFAGTPEAADAYYNLNKLLVCIASYAENGDTDIEAFLNEVNDNNYTPETITDEMLNRYGGVIKACVNAQETLDFLGVKPWNDKLTDFTGKLNKVIGYKDLVAQRVSGYTASKEEPMRTFFNLSSGMLSDDYVKGVALSATFKPFVTNMYEIRSVEFMQDTDWVLRFHYPFGFYRKALYIDTDDSAAVNRYVTSKTARNTRVCRLKDLLEPEKDIVLYLDDSFYNVNKLADKQGWAYTKLQNSENTVQSDQNSVTSMLVSPFSTWLSELQDLDVEAIVKTGGNKTYSRNIKNRTVAYGGDGQGDKKDKYVLVDSQIDRYLKGYSGDGSEEFQDTYTPLQSFAVVSAVYRDSTLYNIMNKAAKKANPVFVSSPNLAGVVGVKQKEFNSIYNYAMLKNLESAMTVNYKTQIDLNQPVYMDIYGNIVTDSGYVVIPAVSNATLVDPSSYDLLNAGFLYLYKTGAYQIPTMLKNSDKYISGLLWGDDSTHNYELGTKIIDNVQINLGNTQLSDASVMQMLYSHNVTKFISSGALPFEERAYIIVEVMRGAPLDSIDKDFEQLNSGVNYSKAGIAAATKLEEMVNSLFRENKSISFLDMPNIAYMSGVEYVFMYAFKLVYIVLFVLLVYRVYIDAVNGSLGLKSSLSFIMAVVMFLVTVFAVPELLDLSYYQVNKHLIQKEAQQIMMLNLEKEQEGREIGVTGVQAPSSTTELFLKVDDMHIPWYAILDNVLVGNSIKTVSQAYEEEYQNSQLAHLPRFERKGSNLYINLNEVFNNSQINYDADTNKLYTTIVDMPYESYVTPYYAVLDCLVARVNEYNTINQICSVETKISKGGNVQTMGIIGPYLMSDDYMQTTQDASGFKDIYDLDSTLYASSFIGTSDDAEKLQYSEWFVDAERYDSRELYEKLDRIDREARKFVADNRSLIGSISDSTFLKVMALHIACSHNNVFKTGNAEAIEVYSVEAPDIIRLSLADRYTVIAQSSKSFPRFVYDNGGTLGVIAVAVLLFMYFVGTFIKTLSLVVVVVCMVMSVVIRRVIKKNNEAAMEGYLISLVVLCSVNILYSFCLKLSIMLPSLGFGCVVSALLQIVLQMLYLFILMALTRIIVSDWAEMGRNRYSQIATMVTMAVHDSFMSISSGVRRIPGDNRISARMNTGKKIKNGEEIVEEMRIRDERRMRHVGRR